MSDRRTILITGAGGFIGSALGEHFRAAGWEVIGLGRDVSRILPAGLSNRRYDLGTPVDPELLAGADVVVHAAYARSEDAPYAFDLNLGAARSLLRAARDRGIDRLVFLSSLSATPDAHTVYGRQKHAVGELFLEHGQTVIRPGLVIGEGGVVEEMRRYLRRRSWLPVVDGGTQPIQTVYIGDLLDAISAVVDRELTGDFTVAEPEPVPYREFFLALAAEAGMRARVVPVPYAVLSAAVATSRLLGIRLAVSRDTLLGLRQLRRVDVRPSLERLGIEVRSFRESLAALREGSRS